MAHHKATIESAELPALCRDTLVRIHSHAWATALQVMFTFLREFVYGKMPRREKVCGNLIKISGADGSVI